jgi:hypothetical protein
MKIKHVIESPDSADVEKDQSLVIANAKELKVSNVDEHEIGQEILKGIARAEKRVKELFAEPKRLAHAAHKAITTAESALLDPLTQATKIVWRKCSEFKIEQQRIADEEARKLQEEARKAAEAQQIAEAMAAEEAGDNKAAEEIIAAPTVVPEIKVKADVAKVEGIGERWNYKAECENLLTLAKHCVEHPEDLAYLQPNTSAISQRAKSQKDGFKLPGCKLVKEPVLMRRI